MEDGRKQAIVLSGGGANGAYEVGVLKALLGGESPATGRAPLEPDIVTATSVGAFNATFLVSRWEAGGRAAVSDLEAVWRGRLGRDPSTGANGAYRFLANPLELFDPRRFAADPFGTFTRAAGDGLRLLWDFLDRFMYVVNPRDEEPLATRLLHTVAIDNFISRDPFRRLVEEVIDYAAVRYSEKTLKVSTTDWETGQVREFVNDDFTDRLGPRIIMASSAIPGFFTPQEVGAHPYVDGSVLMNTPLLPAIMSGAEELHIVYLDPDVDSIPIHYLSNVLSTLYRTQVINWAARVNDDISDARHINEALLLLGRAGAGGGASAASEGGVLMALSAFGERLEKAGRYKLLTIHRYHPRDELGGPLSLLDLRRERIEYLIERGFDDAARHDCEASNCVLPPAPLGEFPDGR